MNELKPNFTQIPNVVLDVLMSKLTDAEFRCLIYICRRTYGFHRQSDSISYSQFQDGLEGLDGGCGLKTAAIARGLAGLVDKGLVEKYIDTKGVNHFSIILMEEVYRKESDTTIVKEEPPLSLRYIQKKEKERKESKHSIEYLMDIPKDDLSVFLENYNATKEEVRIEGEKAYNWIKATGKKYTDFQAMLRNWLMRTYGKRKIIKTNDASQL